MPITILKKPVVPLAELHAKAKALYNADDNKVKPTWDQLGEATKSVWVDRVKKST